MSGILTNPEPVALFWSTGKDSALALDELRKNLFFRVDLLILTISQITQRVGMHGLPAELALMQANATGIPVYLMEVPDPSTNKEYEKEIEALKKYLKEKNIYHVAFGDIFLQEIRQYREKLFCPDGFNLLFPLWEKNTRELLEYFIKNTFKAIVICCNASIFPKSFCGSYLDKTFPEKLPKDADPCGENGEYHTFCYDAPFFKKSIDFKISGIVEKCYQNQDGKQEWYYFLDIKPI